MGDEVDDARDQWDRGECDGDGIGGLPNRGVSFARRAPADPPPVNVGPARAIAESARGLCVVREGHAPEWCPKAHVVATSQVKAKGDVGDLVVRAWLANEKGWRGVNAPAFPAPQMVLGLRSISVVLELAEGAWTRETLAAELRKLPGVSGVEILDAINRHVPEER